MSPVFFFLHKLSFWYRLLRFQLKNFSYLKRKNLFLQISMRDIVLIKEIYIIIIYVDLHLYGKIFFILHVVHLFYVIDFIRKELFRKKLLHSPQSLNSLNLIVYRRRAWPLEQETLPLWKGYLSIFLYIYLSIYLSIYVYMRKGEFTHV